MARLKPQWDIVLGRSLYDKDFTYAAIGKACKTTDNAVLSYARKYWSKRQCDVERFAKKFSTTVTPALQQPRARPLAEGASTLPPLPSLTFGDD